MDHYHFVDTAWRKRIMVLYFIGCLDVVVLGGAAGIAHFAEAGVSDRADRTAGCFSADQPPCDTFLE
jgi:hypothetical protein